LNDPLNITGYSQVLKQTEIDLVTGEQANITYIIGRNRISQITVKDNTEQELYFTFDGHGSTRVLTDLAGAIVELYSFDAYGNAIGFDPSVALTEFLYSGEQFDSKIGQQYLRARYYDPATGRFNRLDPFFGNLNDPQSLHKYLYTNGDPVNGIDPTGLFTSAGLACSIGIGMSVGAIGIPVVGATYLSFTGQVSPMIILAKLTSYENTWKPAIIATALGSGVSIGLQKIFLQFGKSVASRITPISGLVFGAIGLYESIKMTWKMVSEKLPAEDAEQYIATMLASNIISVILLGGVRFIPKVGSENDINYWELTNSMRKLYNKGQILLSKGKWKDIVKEGLDGMSVEAIIKRGEYLKNQNQYTLALSRLRGFW
jgi:RHS repeat-associated protein